MSRRWWLLPLLLVLTIVVTCVWGLALTSYGPTRFDAYMLDWFRASADSTRLAGPPWGMPVWAGLSWLGNTPPRITVAGLTIFCLLLLRRRQSAFFIAGVLLSGIALSSTIKLLVGRPRPELVAHLEMVSSGSFPSGHALNGLLFYMAAALVLAKFLHRRGARFFLYAAAASLSLATGLSRIALGVHYPSDVIAGWVIGAAWLLLWLGLSKHFQPKTFA